MCAKDRLPGPLGDRGAFPRAANKTSRRTYAEVLQNHGSTIRSALASHVAVQNFADLFLCSVFIRIWNTSQDRYGRAT